MNYYKVIQYGDREDYSTKETIIDEPTFRQYQKLISEGKDKIILKEAIISVSSIKEIVSANNEVAEYQRQGLKIDGLLEPANKPKEIGTKAGRMESAEEILKRVKGKFYKKMGYK